MRTTVVILFYLIPVTLFAQTAKVEKHSFFNTKSKGLIDSLHPASNSPKADSIICYTSIPYLSAGKEIYQNVYLYSKKIHIRSVNIFCYDISAGNDSIQVFQVKSDGFKISHKKREVHRVHLNDPKKDIEFNSLYENILIRNNKLPAGDYITYIVLEFDDTNKVEQAYFNHVDSTLGVNTTVSKKFDDIYSTTSEKQSKTFLSKRVKASSQSALKPSVSIKRSSRKIENELNKLGFTVSNRKENSSKTYLDVYYRDRYIGYYEVDMSEPLADKINRKKARLRNDRSFGVNNELKNNKPVFSQMRESHRDDEYKELTGNISVISNVANGQEEYSQNENNYYEVIGQFEAPIMNIPFQFEGYYTSQDKGRIAKASYFRLHYDSKQSKARLLNLINSYNSKYDQASSRAGTYDMIYKTYINNLKGEKEKLIEEAVKASGIKDPGRFSVDTSGLFKEIGKACENKIKDSLSKNEEKINSADIKGKAGDINKEAKQRYQKVLEKYQKIEEIEQKVKQYEKMLKQYQENNFYDSIIAYDKLEGLKNKSLDETTYKSLAKSAAPLLPEGESKKFMSGLTTLDIGIFSKQISSYTLNGQTIKGIDAGYDFGFCETGFTYGWIEYITRDGVLDKYNGYSGRVSFRPVERHKTTLVYFGYKPSNSMLAEGDFFKDLDVKMPSFKLPMNVFSVLHEGTITKNVDFEAEVATSYRTKNEFEVNDSPLSEKMSYRLGLNASVPNSPVDIKGGYEHVGKRFENNTLPLNLSGTDRYNALVRSSFLKNFLMVGVEYNYLVQHNFVSKSSFSKWGFQVSTSSKRYPSVSISYKPFTTIRAFSDTFNIPQRPIVGEAWLGKVSYQLKKKLYSLRLTALYNKNTSSIDTTVSGSNIKQLNAIFLKGRTNLMLNAGQMETTASAPVHGKNDFLTCAVGYAITPSCTINLGQDIARNKTGLSRYGVNVGGGYRFKNTGLLLRAQFRYNTYKLQESNNWKNLYSGMLDINWQLKFKLKD